MVALIGQGLLWSYQLDDTPWTVSVPVNVVMVACIVAGVSLLLRSVRKPANDEPAADD